MQVRPGLVQDLVDRRHGAVGGNRVRNTFTDRQALHAILLDVAQAKRKVQFESFLFNGEDGERLARALVAKAQQGLPVQVLLDGRAAKYKGDDERLTKLMRAGGVEVRYYNTKQLKHSFGAVEHAKVLVIDDGIAWVGGANFDTEINRDMMSRIEGPAVPAFQETFHDGWRNAGGKVLPVADRPAAKGDVWIAMSQTSPTVHDARDQVLRELRAVRRGDSVDLWMMDLGDHQVVDELVAAHQRGVRLRVLLDPVVPFTDDSGSLQDRLMRRFGKGLPDLYAIHRLQKVGVAVRYYERPAGITKMHTKVWVFTKGADGPHPSRRVIGGSVNALKGAYEFNHEVGFLMYGPGVGPDVQREFLHDFRHQSRAIAPLSLWQRVKARVVKWATGTLI